MENNSIVIKNLPILRDIESSCLYIGGKNVDLSEKKFSSYGIPKSHEFNSVSDLMTNYSGLSKKTKPSVRLFQSVSYKIARSSDAYESGKKTKLLRKKYGNQEKDMIGNNSLMWRTDGLCLDLISPKILLNGVRFEKIETTENELFKACNFYMVDEKGDDIKGVCMYQHQYFDAVSSVNEYSGDLEKQINYVRYSGVPFSVIAHVLNPEHKMNSTNEKRGPSLKVVHIGTVDDRIQYKVSFNRDTLR